jgi:predicted lipid-binding transport protein (Tim44 family)
MLLVNSLQQQGTSNCHRTVQQTPSHATHTDDTSTVPGVRSYNMRTARIMLGVGAGFLVIGGLSGLLFPHLTFLHGGLIVGSVITVLGLIHLHAARREPDDPKY